MLLSATMVGRADVSGQVVLYNLVTAQVNLAWSWGFGSKVFNLAHAA
jgi:hypothetical protein